MMGSILGAVLVTVLLAGCSATAASGSGDAVAVQASPTVASGAPATDAGVTGQSDASDAMAATAVVGTLVPRGGITSTAAGLITPKAGGSVQVDLGDGMKAVLDIPPGAVSEPVIVTLQAFTSGSVHGLRMEPDGLWLTKPGALTVGGAAALLLRIGAMPGGDLFASTVGTAPGSIAVVRLRPVIVEDSSVMPTPIGGGGGPGSGSGTGSGSNGPADFLGPIDPSDGAAAREEAREAEDPDGEVEGTDEVRQEAADATAVMTERCRDPKDPSSARLAATRRTAGASATGGELPDCITRAVVVTAMSEAEGLATQGVPLDYSESLSAEGEVSNEFASFRLPLEGEQTGTGQSLTTFMQAFADMARQENKIWDGSKIPEKINCTVSALKGGQVSVSLEAFEPDQLKVTVEPGGGVFVGSCGGKPVEASPATWDMIRTLKGMGPDEPFVFLLDRGQRTGNQFSDLRMAEQIGGKVQPDGKLVVSAEGVTLKASMWVGLYESMALLEQERKEAEIAGSAKPTAPATP